jgi:hypothetical protein
MADQYFYTRDKTPQGPFSAAQLKQLAADGHIQRTDAVWKEGMGQTVPAAKVKNLFAAPPPALAVPAAPPPPPEAVPATDAPEPAAQVPDQARPAPPPTRKKRVVSIKGAVLMGQDGAEVKFRKKCGVCGHEDTTRSTAAIRTGATRVPFFCPRCKRTRAVEIIGAG